MQATILQDTLYRAQGRAAAAIGQPCDAYRPHGADTPLSPANRYLRIRAGFTPLGGRLNRPVGFGEALWEGIFDAAYTRPGDILLRKADGAAYIIAAQQPLLPVLCIHAPRRVTVTRQASPAAAGLSAYGGAITATDLTLATEWPASILTGSGAGTAGAGLQADLQTGSWQVLLPPSLDIDLRKGDRLHDDIGRIGVIATAEPSPLGWRITASQAST